jgi:hypothetical protein
VQTNTLLAPMNTIFVAFASDFSCLDRALGQDDPVHSYQCPVLTLINQLASLAARHQGLSIALF